MKKFLKMDARVELLSCMARILEADERVRFAYLYGSAVEEESDETANDIDIALYAADGVNPYELSADLKIAFQQASGLAPDVFDIRIINDIVEKGDLFGLLYLRQVLQRNFVIVDKDEHVRTDFIESFSLKYRECEGLIDEVLA